MATFYQGTRPVLKGRNSNDNYNPYKKKVGVYSNWSIYNTSHVLDGAPDHDHVPGTGYFPHGITLSRKFLGLDTLSPMDGAGGGARLSYGRFRPLEFKGLPGALAFGPGFGHTERHNLYTYSHYSNAIFDGVPSADVMAHSGHIRRYINGTGTASSFGAFDPYVYKGTTPQALASAGRVEPEAGTEGVYGHEHVLVWTGVPSGRAL